MNWNAYYQGTGTPAAHVELPPPPPWRTLGRTPRADVFQPPDGLVDAVNAALCLRRPLLITGPPGSGKSTVIEQVAVELGLGRVLRWHITSRSTLADALYRYDALGRIHAQRLHQELVRAQPERAADFVDDIAAYVQLGPLGTALLPSTRPRALLIDEIDKSDLDLPGDLLDVPGHTASAPGHSRGEHQRAATRGAPAHEGAGRCLTGCRAASALRRLSMR